MSLPRTMKATILYGPNDIRVEEVPVPKPGPHEVIIRVHVDGICPTGVHAIKLGKQWGPPGVRIPGFPGHEFAGEVVAVGEHVKGIKVGDRVVAELLARCGTCYYCRIGKPNLCTNIRRTGYMSWAEYVKTYDFLTYKIPDHISYEEAAFTEPLACCLNGIEQANIRPGDDVLVVGAGPMGLLIAQLAKNVKGARVIVSDLLDTRLETARKLGIHATINPRKVNIVEKVKELTDGMGPNVVIVTVGDTKVQEESVKMVRPAGTVVFFAGVHISGEPLISVNSNFIHYGEVNITGAYDKTPEQFRRALKLITIGAIKVKPLISHRIPLDKIHEGIEIVDKRKGLKVMVYP